MTPLSLNHCAMYCCHVRSVDPSRAQPLRTCSSSAQHDSTIIDAYGCRQALWWCPGAGRLAMQRRQQSMGSCRMADLPQALQHSTPARASHPHSPGTMAGPCLSLSTQAKCLSQMGGRLSGKLGSEK